MIKIGISSCFMYPNPSRPTFGHKSLSYVECDMMRFVCQPGVLPILIPDIDPKRQKEILDQCDGFVMQGGVDLAPSTYGQKPLDEARWPGDRYRDKYELKIVDHAFKNNKPILGICRGFQLLNVYFKGTLYQDLVTETHTDVEHRCADKYDKVHHDLLIKTDSILYQVYREEHIQVNSVHHQGVQFLGEGLVAEAVCVDDNLIEAFHHEDLEKNFIWGVQWHPEFNHSLKGKIASEMPIIERFLTEVSERKEK